MTRAFRSILVGTDLQAPSRPVVEFAAKLARASEARLFLLHVIEPGSLDGVPRAALRGELSRREADCGRALEALAAELEAAGTRVYTGHVAGRPAYEVLLERVEGTETDLVVVGSSAREGRGHALGSTADRLLRTSPVPCLIVRGRASFPVRRAAAGTDFSSHAHQAIRVAAPWLDALGEGKAELEILHAADAPGLSLDPSVEGWVRDRLAEEVERFAGNAGAARVTSRMCSGERPVDALVAAAQEHAYQLLITGTHGHGPLRRALVGSVAMGLAQSAPCPVLVVPPRAAG